MATYLGQPGVEADSDPTEVVATDVLPEKVPPQTPPGRVTPGSVLHSHWSRSNDARISLVESFIVLLAPAGLWMRGAGSLWHKIAGVATPWNRPRHRDGPH